VLCHGFLYRFNSPSDVLCKDLVPLDGGACWDAARNCTGRYEKQNGVFAVGNRKMRTYFLTSRSKDTNNEWIGALQEQMLLMQSPLDKNLPQTFGKVKNLHFDVTSHVDWDRIEKIKEATESLPRSSRAATRLALLAELHPNLEPGSSAASVSLRQSDQRRTAGRYDDASSDDEVLTPVTRRRSGSRSPKSTKSRSPKEESPTSSKLASEPSRRKSGKREVNTVTTVENPFGDGSASESENPFGDRAKGKKKGAKKAATPQPNPFDTEEDLLCILDADLLRLQSPPKATTGNPFERRLQANSTRPQRTPRELQPARAPQRENPFF